MIFIRVIILFFIFSSFLLAEKEQCIGTLNTTALFENIGQAAQYKWASARGKKNWEQHLYCYQECGLKTPLNSVIASINVFTEISDIATKCASAMQIITKIINHSTSRPRSQTALAEIVINKKIESLLQKDVDAFIALCCVPYHYFDTEKCIERLNLKNPNLAHECLIQCLQLSQLYQAALKAEQHKR